MKLASFLSTLILISFLTIISCSNTETEDQYFYLNGTVKDASGSPVENAIIQLAYDMDTLKSKPSKIIKFFVDSTRQVNLWVTRKSNGERVKTLVDSVMTAGVKEVNWDLTNETGKTIRNDAYLLHLKIKNSELTSLWLVNNQITDQAYNNLEYYAKTDQSGNYQIDLSNLPVGIRFEAYNENGDSLIQTIVSPTVKVWAIKPDNSRSIIKTITVQPNANTSTDINFAK